MGSGGKLVGLTGAAERQAGLDVTEYGVGAIIERPGPGLALAPPELRLISCFSARYQTCEAFATYFPSRECSRKYDN